MENLTYEINLIGYRKAPWECFKFSIMINGEEFDYHVGIGHSKRLEDKQGFALSGSEIRKITEDGYTLKSSIPETRYNIVGASKIFQVPCLVRAPKIEDVLNCLFLDSEALEYNFKDWCDNFGYDDDSIKAKKTYEECVENSHRLKKALGKNFESIKKQIQDMEL